MTHYRNKEIRPLARAVSPLRLAFTFACGLGLAPAAGAHGGDAPVYDRADFAVSAGRDVENDRLVAVLFAQAQGQKQSALADEVNRAVAWAVDAAKAVDAVKVSTLGYQSSPIYRQQKIQGWQVRQSIRLESRNADALSTLIATLQSRLGLESVGYDVSPERRTEVERELISEALAAFRARARQVAEEMGRPGFRIVRFSVNTSGGRGRVPMARARGMAAAEMQAVSAPTLEAGEQRVQVSVNGEIELELPR